MTVASAANAANVRVPAWKKIGLKLKNAPDTVSEITSDSSTLYPTPSKSDKSSSNDTTSDNPATLTQSSPLTIRQSKKDLQSPRDDKDSKKSKKRKASEADTVTSHNDQTDIEPGAGELGLESTPSSSKKADRPSKRRKSVSFAQDTKVGDGDSAQATPVDEILHEEAAAAKAEKKQKKSKSAVASSESETGPKESKSKARDVAKTAYVDYLLQFHNDKDSWKFNKSKQNDLLKNFFNIYRIAPEHNKALIAYIEGLQGEGARQRLKDEAEKLITELKQTTSKQLPDDNVDMSDLAARKAAYTRAEEASIERIKKSGKLTDKAENDIKETTRRRIAQDERATELLLLRSLAAATGPSPAKTVQLPTPASSQPTSDATPSARALKKRKRKSRTAASDSDSSSSSESESESDSDSSSDSDSESDDSNTKTTPKKPAKKTKAAKKADSDSDSSSEDSESESDSSSSESESESDSSESESEPAAKSKVTKKTKKDTPAAFDEEFLDKAFGPRKSYQRARH